MAAALLTSQAPSALWAPQAPAGPRHDSPAGVSSCPNQVAPGYVHHEWRHSPPEGSAIEMKATRKYVAAIAATVTATAGLLVGTGLMAGSASAGGFPAFV